MTSAAFTIASISTDRPRSSLQRCPTRHQELVMPSSTGRYLPGCGRFAARLALLVAMLAAPAARLAAQQPAQVGASIVGRVADARTQQGVAGVSVVVSGTRLGAITGDDGRFRINGAPAGARTLTFRRLGYASVQQSVTVGEAGQVTANVELQVAATPLDEVIVTGTAGGEQRRSIGNAVVTIDAADAMSKSASQSVSSLIGARAPGVIIAPSTGRLGAGPSIQIRGRSSIGLDNSPLLYVDGVRVNNALAAGPVGVSGRLGGQASNVAGRLNDISPEDIESIEIIKGPAAATI
jgi:TonB-dependent starch-binding outer membrane protein SusC